MKKLRTAVIGLGRIGWQFHMPNLKKHNGFELVAAADPLQERLDEAKDVFGARGYTNYKTMLENEKLDLVVIASPTPFHLEQATTVMECGIDVFLEKPMAQSLEEADTMIEVMDKCKRKLMVYQPRRMDADIQSLINILKSDIIGPIYMIQGCRTSDYVRRNDWQALKKYSGGMLNNYGSHFIDQLLYITGSTAKHVSCHLRCIASIGDADDVVKTLIETESGVILDMDINRATAFPMPQWLVLGKYGSIRYIKDSNDKEMFQIKYLKPQELPPLELKPEMAAQGRSYSNFEELTWHEKCVDIDKEGSFDYYNYCYSYYAEGKKPFVPIETTREVMRILDECRKSSAR